MRFLILGPLEAYDRERRLSLGGAKQRGLLAMLLLHANEVVSSDRLVDALWGDAASEDAAKALSVAVSRLRKVLEPERSPGAAGELRPPGYLLRLEDDQLDLHRFERLVVEARNVEDPATATGLLREALALWRGPPLADLGYESFGQAEIARLEESRLAALEQRIESDLTLGRHDELVGELEGLTAQHPLRERLRGQLMLVLYRSGRQAEALQSYQAARTSLVDELGIEPGRALRELHQAILQQDPGLDLPVREHPVAETPGGTFVGRGRELAELVAGLEDAFAGRGRLFLLSGEPGIGKTRLAEELMEHARARGARVLVGRWWRGAPAYWPGVQSLRAYVRESDPAALGTGPVPPTLPRSSRSCVSAFRICRHRPRSSRSPRDFACSTRPPSSCTTPLSAARSCSCSMTSTQPMLRRSCCCAFSPGRSARCACCCSARIATSIPPPQTPSAQCSRRSPASRRPADSRLTV